MVMNERDDAPKSVVLEKNWNFGISTGYPHFVACKSLISLGILKLSTVPIWFFRLEFCWNIVPIGWNGFAQFQNSNSVPSGLESDWNFGTNFMTP
jgi:hypothetical protein